MMPFIVDGVLSAQLGSSALARIIRTFKVFLSDLVQLMVDRPRTSHTHANLSDVLEWLTMLDTGDAAAIDRGSEGRENARTENLALGCSRNSKNSRNPSYRGGFGNFWSFGPPGKHTNH